MDQMRRKLTLGIAWVNLVVNFNLGLEQPALRVHYAQPTALYM